MKSPTFRIGHGYDLHRLVEKRKLILGGVEIPHEKGLLGHSDADVLIHSLADSILGALALPDIGHFFPDHDSKNKNLDSKFILLKAMQQCNDAQYEISNLDLTLIAQRPKILPYVEKIRENLSNLLKISTQCIGLKATTHEKIGCLGREEGIAAFAVCLLQKT